MRWWSWWLYEKGFFVEKKERERKKIQSHVLLSLFAAKNATVELGHQREISFDCETFLGKMVHKTTRV